MNTTWTSNDHHFDAFKEDPIIERVIEEKGYTVDTKGTPSAPEDSAEFWYMFIKESKIRRYNGNHNSPHTDNRYGVSTAVDNLAKTYPAFLTEQRFIAIENRLSVIETSVT